MQRPSSPSDSLPPELHTLIAKHLEDVRDVLRLRLASRGLRGAAARAVKTPEPLRHRSGDENPLPPPPPPPPPPDPRRRARPAPTTGSSTKRKAVEQQNDGRRPWGGSTQPQSELHPLEAPVVTVCSTTATTQLVSFAASVRVSSSLCSTALARNRGPSRHKHPFHPCTLPPTLPPRLRLRHSHLPTPHTTPRPEHRLAA